MNGRFLRNGPNPQTDVSSHWYRNRYVQTPLKAQFGIDPFTGIGKLYNKR